MIFYPQSQITFFLIHVALLIIFSIRFKEYTYNRKIRILIFFFCVALTTKVIDIVFIYYVDMYSLGPYNIYYALPLFSCDITLVAAMFMIYFNTKGKGKENKTYEVINKLITYMLFSNGVIIPLILADSEPIETYLKFFNNNYISIFVVDNNIVHYTYGILVYLYGSTFNVFKKTYKGFWKILAANAGVTLVVHIINLIFKAAGYETTYMYTVSYPDDGVRGMLYSIFGRNAEIAIKLITAPILECYLGTLLFVSSHLLLIYLIHMFYYKASKKEGTDNLFYLKLIIPNTSFDI